MGVWLLSIIGLSFEFGVVVALLRGRHYRRFPLLLALSTFGVAVELACTIALRQWGGSSHAYALLYWTQDFVMHGLILCLILTLIGQAIQGSRSASRTMLVLGAGTIAWGLGWLAALHNETAWRTALSARLSFCEEMLNFILWMALIRSRLRDTLLFLVSAGIGIQVTGEVIGHTIRVYAHKSGLLWLPDLLVLGSEMVCLLIWTYAFWTAPPAARKQAAAPAA